MHFETGYFAVASEPDPSSQQLPWQILCCFDVQVAIATSKRIQDANGTKKSGLHWSIPLILSNCKEGEDRNRIQCMVFDFVIHPGTCRMAMNNARYKVRPRAGRSVCYCVLIQTAASLCLTVILTL